MAPDIERTPVLVFVSSSNTEFASTSEGLIPLTRTCTATERNYMNFPRSFGNVTDVIK